jgi:hypothetical protein
MTARTRYFVIVSLLVLGVGLGTGLVAYYTGFPAGAFARAGGPDELQFVPRDATLIAYADVREIMTSELRQKLHSVIPVPADGQHEFEEKTGINIETDIDRVVACVNPDRTSTSSPGSGMVLARGRFNETKIESLMREHGAQAEDYRGKRFIAGTISPDSGKSHEFAAAFLEPGLVALGSTKLVRSAVDLHQTGDNPQAGLQSVTGNEELMNLVKTLETGNNFWAVGRFDALQTQAHLPQEVTNRLPALTVFGRRSRQRRTPRHPSSGSAGRRSRQQPARRRSRVPGPWKDSGGFPSRYSDDDAVARTVGHRQNGHALIHGAGGGVRRGSRYSRSAAAKTDRPLASLSRVVTGSLG